ncbi:MAG: lysostaphin resistance A-like protein [Oscillospiraceae bacterium]
MSRKKELISLIIGYIGSMLGLFALRLFNQNILMTLPLWGRMISMIVTYWLIALVPIIIMAVNKEKPSDYGFTKEKLGNQIAVGILVGIAMSLVLTLLPHLLGFGEYFSSGKNYTELWQFVYEFFYCIPAVGAAEELVFRGFIYKKIMDISGKAWVAVAVSSILFGLFHIFGGSIAQIVMTSFIGTFFCLCRMKIRNCTLLSLIIAHGLYDAMIVVWTAII